jgi:hypothetical protein
MLISVDPDTVERFRKERAATRDAESKAEDESRLRLQSDRFIRMASHIFGRHLIGIPAEGPLRMLTEVAIGDLWHGGKPEIPEDDRELADLYCSAVVENLIHKKVIPWGLREKGPVAVAALIQEKILEWGMTLPDNWDTLAQEYEAGGEAEE